MTVWVQLLSSLRPKAAVRLTVTEPEPWVGKWNLCKALYKA